MKPRIATVALPAILLGLLLAVTTAPDFLRAADEDTPASAAPRGRLPLYYARVVTPDQRAQIYKIQQSYAEEIAALESQLAALVAKRNAEVAAVLTDEQRAKVEQFAAEARSRRTSPTPATETAESNDN